MSNSELRHVTRDSAVSISPETTVEDAISAVMDFTPTEDGVSVYYVYVTDNEDLVGVVSMRELLNAENSVPVSEIMTTEVVTIDSSSTSQAAIRQIIKHRFPVLPVSDGGTFVGIVRASDVIDALDEQTTKRMFKQAGFWFR